MHADCALVAAQDGYFEEALRVRNLLQEFTPYGTGTRDERPITIVGFPEHVFTQSAGTATASARARLPPSMPSLL